MISSCRNDDGAIVVPLPIGPSQKSEQRYYAWMTVLPPLPTLYFPHGAGPCFFMDWPDDPQMWHRTAAFLRHTGQALQPRAILIVSGHWQAGVFTTGATVAPELIYDYSGFPPHTYQLRYPAQGDAALAQRVRDLLARSGLAAAHDEARGQDHGVFVPLKVMYPDARIPVVQLSLKAGLDADEHLRAGQALQTLRREGVLILGSGLSFHNMRGFTPTFYEASAQFDDWLATMAASPARERDALLRNWQAAPHAHDVHPYPDHLLPLMVAAGAAGADLGTRVFQDTVMHVKVSALAFGGWPRLPPAT